MSQRKSLYRPISKEAVIVEYAEASRSPNDYERAKWGSHEGMINRFRLGLSLIDWQQVKRWIDIGCGTGLFFSIAEAAQHRFEQLVGIDITPEILACAHNRTYVSPASFIAADMEALPDDRAGFDLVTLIGVLQQCGMPPERALAVCISRLKTGGQIFLTTKHLGWQAFIDGTLSPEPGHSWFDFDELSEMVCSLQVEIVQSGGFLPREGQIVPVKQSHTFFIVGKKL